MSISAVFLLLGLIFLTLTATVFYDIPQLNLGSALHHHMDLHVPQQQQQQTPSRYILIFIKT
jgi:hypothetical protein